MSLQRILLPPVGIAQFTRGSNPSHPARTEGKSINRCAVTVVWMLICVFQMNLMLEDNPCCRWQFSRLNSGWTYIYTHTLNCWTAIHSIDHLPTLNSFEHIVHPLTSFVKTWHWQINTEASHGQQNMYLLNDLLASESTFMNHSMPMMFKLHKSLHTSLTCKTAWATESTVWQSLQGPSHIMAHNSSAKLKNTVEIAISSAHWIILKFYSNSTTLIINFEIFSNVLKCVNSMELGPSIRLISTSKKLFYARLEIHDLSDNNITVA